MRIATLCRERARLLIQISKESEQFEEQAAYLAYSWLVLASLRERLILTTRTESKVRPRH
jgi:hypothetical protein